MIKRVGVLVIVVTRTSVTRYPRRLTDLHVETRGLETTTRQVGSKAESAQLFMERGERMFNFVLR
jgi:hypothetical protein